MTRELLKRLGQQISLPSMLTLVVLLGIAAQAPLALLVIPPDSMLVCALLLTANIGLYEINAHQHRLGAGRDHEATQRDLALTETISNLQRDIEVADLRQLVHSCYVEYKMHGDEYIEDKSKILAIHTLEDRCKRLSGVSSSLEADLGFLVSKIKR